MKLHSIDEVNAAEAALTKVVKVGDEWRFLMTENPLSDTHRQMVSDAELPLVNGAGILFLFRGYFRVAVRQAGSLQSAGCERAVLTIEHEAELAALIKRPLRSESE